VNFDDLIFQNSISHNSGLPWQAYSLHLLWQHYRDRARSTTVLKAYLDSASSEEGSNHSDNVDC